MIVSVLLLVLSANLDTLVIAVSYGMKNIRIPFLANLIISFITTLGTYLSMAFGEVIGRFFPEAFANYLGSCVLILIGLGTIASYLFRKDNNTETQGEPQDTVITVGRGASLAVALCLNNIALGIAASVSGVSAGATAVCTFIVTIVFLIAGTAAGRWSASRKIGRLAPLISGLLLVLLGAAELWMK
jgi:putative Mn2+ efflux pump MntP